MNKILKSALILAAVLTSSTSLFGQRAVMVNSSNSVLLYPNNFWSVNASAARAGLGLAPYVTNPVVPLTNGGTGATNAAAARTNIGLGASWLTNTNVLDFRTAVGLGWTALTNSNAATSLLGYNTNGQVIYAGTNVLTFTNSSIDILQISSGGDLVWDVVNNSFYTDASFYSSIDWLGTNASASKATTRTNLGLGWSALTNTNAATSLLGYNTDGQVVAATNVVWTNSFGFSTNTVAAQVRTNLLLGWSALTNTNATNFRASIGLGWPALTNTNAAEALLGYNTTNGQIVANTTNALTFTNTSVAFSAGDISIQSPNILWGNVAAINLEERYLSYDGQEKLRWQEEEVQLSVPLIFSGTNTAPATRANLGLGATWLTNTNVTNFRTAIGLGTTNQVAFQSLVVSNSTDFLVASFNTAGANPLEVYATDENLTAGYGTSAYAIGVGAFGFQVKYGASDTNWGYPVLTDEDGYVVNPSNFWQLAPIATTVTSSTPITNSTNTAANSRNLILTSLSPAINNVTNTLLLPTNTSTFNGDTAVVIHAGGSGSATAIRQTGSATNLIVLTNFDHAVRFLYSGNAWDFYHNLAYVEPVYFSGTNAAANAASSRTNLGLGWSALTNTSTATSLLGFNTNGQVIANAGTNTLTLTNSIEINPNNNDSMKFTVSQDAVSVFSGAAGENIVSLPADDIPVFSSDYYWNHPSVRSAFGFHTNLDAAWTATNKTNFQVAVFATNTTPTNAGNFGNHVAWMEVTIQTNGTNASFRVPLYQ